MRFPPLLAICLILSALACGSDRVESSKPMPVRGVSLAHLHAPGVGYGSDDCRKQLDTLASLGANWISVTEFAYMPAIDSPQLRFGGDRSMTRDDVAKTIADAHARGIKVLVKPHLWSRAFHDGKFAGDIEMKSGADWDAWFAAYGDYVVDSATRAQAAGADAFCVGVELQKTSHRTPQWRALIARVRSVFKGALTYAATHGEWVHIQFWDDLDCIGINAYFQLADSKSPDDATIRAGWKHAFDLIDPVARRFGKPVCFTELGYSVSAKAALQPWAYDDSEPDAGLQARLYRIALEEAKSRDYMVGVFVWKWFTSDQWQRFEEHDAFALQEHPQAIAAIAEAWKPSK
jgi:hypothetical protein